MHISGKILAALVGLLGLGGVYLTAKTLGVRQAWMQQAQKNQEDLEKKRLELVTANSERDRKRAEFVRAIVGWERAYEGSTVAVEIDANGNFAIDGVGSTNGVATDDVLYIFVPGQEPGSSTFLTAVKVAQVADNRVSAVPYVRLRQGEIQATGQKLFARVRKLVPTRFQNEVAAIDQRLLLLEQSLANAAADQTFLKDLQDRTDLLIAERMKELNGNPDLEGSNVPEVYRAGLLASIASEEELRNAALLESDLMLRRLLRTRQRLEEVLDLNNQLTRSLPQPVTTQPAATQAANTQSTR